LAVEVPVTQLGHGKLDLAAEFDDGRAVFEFKFPRGSRGPISPDTMTLGEMLKDFTASAASRPSIDGSSN